jgi:hypothetical protein
MFAVRILPVLLTGTLFGQTAAPESDITRVGADWVRTRSGVFTAKPLHTIEVLTRASVAVTGTDVANQVVYRVRQRTSARNVEEAKRLFGLVQTSWGTTSDGRARMVVQPIRNDPKVRTELEIQVPRQIQELILHPTVGGVKVVDVNGRVHAATVAGRIELDRIGKGVIATTGGGEIWLGKIGGPVRCDSAGGSIHVESAGGETRCETAGGEIFVREAAGPVTAITEGGNIQVERAASWVAARSAEGLIEVIQALGEVIAEARGGSIQIGAARGAKCESAAGAIRVKNISGPMRMTTAIGSILAEVAPGSRLENSFLTAGSGDITVLIPSKLALKVQARNETGRPGAKIVSDFKEIRVTPAEWAPFRPVLAEGALNGGGSVLMISAAGGTIYLRKQK